MTFLPIVDRELRTASRLTVTYRNRTLTAALVAAVAFLMLSASMMTSVPAYIGLRTFYVISGLTLIFCLLEGVRKTADCLSEEKREGTIGLLFLTDLKGYDVILGKLVANSLNSFYGLIAILPILGLPLLIGGVMGMDFIRMVLALGNILFFSLCAGMWVSCWSLTTRQSTGRTVLLMTLCGVASLPVLAGLHPIMEWNPVRAYWTCMTTVYVKQGDDYWRSILAGQGMSWLMLVWASWAVPRTWQEKAVRAPLARRVRLRSREADARERARMLDINPVYWLASRTAGQRMFVWVFVGIFGFLCAAATFASGATFMGFVGGVAVLGMIFNLLLKMRVGAQAVTAMAEARRNNALEMMLATPLKVDDIIRGQLLALKRTFLVPVIAILAVEILGLYGAMFISWALTSYTRNGPEIAAQQLMLATFVMVPYLVLFVLDIFAVIWAGMWFGLTAKSEGQAAAKTILLVLVAPVLITPMVVFGCYAIGLFVGWPIFWITWTSGKLRREFRTIAGQRFDAARGESGWIPGVGTLGGGPQVPPVIETYYVPKN